MSRRSTDRVSKAKEAMERMNQSDFKKDLGMVHNAAVSFDGKPVEQVPLEKLVPAPKEWNFFPPISDGKMLEMMLSIQENGLFNPVILWQQGKNYMILSGHNRVDAFNRILLEYGDAKDFDKREFEDIPAIIYGEHEIDELKAKEIIIDTNYIQRDEDKRLLPIIIKNRIEITKNRKDRKGRTVDLVAKELGLSKTKVYEDYTIGKQIIPELAELFFDEKITKKALLRFVWYNKGVQKYLYDKFKNNITTENAMQIKRNMSRDELSKIFSQKTEDKTVVVQVRIPESLKDEFRKMFDEWIKTKE